MGESGLVDLAVSVWANQKTRLSSLAPPFFSSVKHDLRLSSSKQLFLTARSGAKRRQDRSGLRDWQAAAGPTQSGFACLLSWIPRFLVLFFQAELLLATRGSRAEWSTEAVVGLKAAASPLFFFFSLHPGQSVSQPGQLPARKYSMMMSKACTVAGFRTDRINETFPGQRRVESWGSSSSSSMALSLSLLACLSKAPFGSCFSVRGVISLTFCFSILDP